VLAFLDLVPECIFSRTSSPLPVAGNPVSGEKFTEASGGGLWDSRAHSIDEIDPAALTTRFEYSECHEGRQEHMKMNVEPH